MRKKKIAVLHAQVPFMRGGAELMTESLVRELKIRNYDAELISIPFRWYPENGLYDNLLMWKMLDLTEINGDSIDLVIASKFPTYGINHPNKVLWLMHQHRLAYDLYDSKYGLSVEHNGEKIRNKIKEFDNKSIKECKKVFSISQNIAVRLKKYNGIDATPLYHPPAMVGKYYCENYEKYVLSVGRLDPLKRNDLLLRALPFCEDTIKVKIAGRGPELENLKKLAKSLGVEHRVEFLGYVTDDSLLRLYANAGAVCYAPVDEDYGYITLEAFLSQKPIITCNDSGGVLEFAENEINGQVCEPHPEALGESIDKMFRHTSKLQELGNNGYDKIKNISWDCVIEELTKGI